MPKFKSMKFVNQRHTFYNKSKIKLKNESVVKQWKREELFTSTWITFLRRLK